MKMKTRKDPLSKTEALVLRLRADERKPWKEIATRLGLSRGRVIKIFEQTKERLADFAEHGEHSMKLLPGRAQNVLFNVGLDTYEKVRDAVESGRLWWNDAGIGSIVWEKHGLRNGGWKSWIAIQDWLGMRRTVRREIPPRNPL